MDRRSLVLLAPAAALSACASRAPKSPSEIPDVKSIGLLRLKERPATGNLAPFNASLSPAVAAKEGGTVTPVNAATLGMAIGQALRAASDASTAADRATIVAALRPLDFSPRAELTTALTAAFERHQVPITSVEDDAAGERARTDWDFSGIPSQMDALLDIDLQYCGYYFEKKAGGFVPSVYFSAILLGTRNGGSRIERYYAQADVWPAGGERRYITTNPKLTLRTLDEFGSKRDLIRDEMRSLLAAMAELLAEDVARTVQKLPQLP